MPISTAAPTASPAKTSAAAILSPSGGGLARGGVILSPGGLCNKVKHTCTCTCRPKDNDTMNTEDIN